jgi:mRNA interferase RelE/StbE
MGRYRLLFRASVARDLRKIPKADVKRILAAIESLCRNPRPPGSEKLSGEEKYRLRQGNYRILYEICEQEVLVHVVKVGHRRDIYR